MSTAPGNVIPSVKDWAAALPEEEPDEFAALPEDLGPSEDPRPAPVDAISVVVGVKHNPMKFGKRGPAPRGAAKSTGTAGSRSARAWAAKGRAATKAKGKAKR